MTIKPERFRWLAAELLIVVLGVMIALGVDQWRGGRSDRVKERMYLTRVLSELRADSARLHFIERGLDAKDEALASVAGWLNGGPPQDSIQLASSALFGWVLPSQPAAAFEEMMSTGSLALIRNDELRNEIISHYRVWDHWLTRADQRRSAYPNLLYQLMPPSEKPGNVNVWIDSESAQRLLATIPRQELSRAVMHELNYSRFLREEMIPPVREEINSLLRDLTEELGRS